MRYLIFLKFCCVCGTKVRSIEYEMEKKSEVIVPLCILLISTEGLIILLYGKE